MNDFVTVSNLVESLQHSFPQLNEDNLVLQIRQQLKQIIETKDAKPKSDEQAREFGRQIMELSYHLEDFVESSALEIASRRNEFFGRIFRRSSQQMFIQHLQTKLNRMIRLLKEYSSSISQQHHAIDDESREGEISTNQAGLKEPKVAENVVGKNDQMIVAEVLTKGSGQLSFISICGMGGTGKTKLAKRVFSSQHISDHFQVCAWVRVSQVYQRRRLLLDILGFICGPTTDMMHLMLLSDEDLDKRTYQTLKDKRYLIVLDDIWSADAWLSISVAFPSDDNGSRILLTTRTRDVALAVGGPNTHIFDMKMTETMSMVEKKLLDALTGGSKQLSFISICGMGGTGKTKLAKRVFNSQQISDHFQVRAWIHVSHVYQRRDLLLAILGDICGPTADMMHLIKLLDEDLAKQTHQSLKDKRYLIVLDDIWSADAWLSIRNAFPSDDNGSKILLTSQITEVALEVGGPNTHILNLEANKMILKQEKRLLDDLTSEKKQLSFISICGTGGTGKTTLAKCVFNSLSIVHHFDVRAWVCVSDVDSRGDILLVILISILGPTISIMDLAVSDEELAERTYKTLKQKRYLIVLDDIWSVDTWLSIRIAFPSDDNGSRILLTTRTSDVALAVGGPDTIIHNMTSTLADVEDWESLRHKAGLDERQLEPEMERICKEIVMRSGGELLVGIMINNMLKAMTTDECKVMLQDIVNRSAGQQIGVVDVLKLSYYALPLHLRPCLLYLGHFPKDSKIDTQTLYQLWAAERIVPMANTRGERMMIAERYLDDLAKGSWVQTQEMETSTRGRFKSCYLDDAMEDLCISKVKDDELIDSPQENDIMSSAFRRAISLDKYERTNIHLYGKADYLRSLLLFSSCQSEEGFIRPREISNLDRFIWLRVLCLRGVDFKDGKFPKGLEKLIYLRYLSFRECYLVELPSSISKMLYLQTLDLRVRNECEMTIPNVLGNLEKLRYLYLPLAYRCPNRDEKLNLGNLNGLEIVENFDTRVCDAEDIFKLNNLTDLSVSVEGNALPLILNYLEKRSTPLSWISLDIRNFDCYTKQRRSVMEKLFNCSDIHALGVEGYLGKIPEFDKISSKLTKIVLNGSEFEDDPMQILQHLNHLKVLALEIEAYVGIKVECSSFGFPELRYLKLSKLYNLEQWEVEEDAMPKLCTLVIEKCKDLQMLPEGLKFISGLRNLEIASMPPGFVGRIRKSDGTAGEDFLKLRHVKPNVKIDGQPLILRERQQAPSSARPGEDPQSSWMSPAHRRVARESSFDFN